VSRTALFLFDTTHHVLWAEELAMEAEIPADVVPAPPDRGEARCDLALETFAARAAELAEVLTREGVVFFSPGEDGLVSSEGTAPSESQAG